MILLLECSRRTLASVLNGDGVCGKGLKQLVEIWSICIVDGVGDNDRDDDGDAVSHHQIFRHEDAAHAWPGDDGSGLCSWTLK